MNTTHLNRNSLRNVIGSKELVNPFWFTVDYIEDTSGDLEIPSEYLNEYPIKLEIM